MKAAKSDFIAILHVQNGRGFRLVGAPPQAVSQPGHNKK
jgi:hypothetical protein